MSQGISIKITGTILEGEGQQRLQQVVSQTLDKVLPTLKTEVAKETPVGVSGQARAGVSYKKNSWHSGTSYEKGPATQYIEVIEKGRTPGKQMPPSEPIELWLRRTDKGKAFVMAVQEKYNLSPERALKQATFLKQRAIGKLGTRKVEMFKKTYEKRKTWVVMQFKTAFGKF